MVHWQQADASGAYVSRQLSSDEETPRYSPGRTASIFIQERSLGLYGTAGSAEQLAPLHIEAVAEREASKPQLRCIFVLQMLVCMEIPSTKLEELPGPLRVEALIQKIQLHREKYLQEIVLSWASPPRMSKTPSVSSLAPTKLSESVSVGFLASSTVNLWNRSWMS